MPQRSSTIRPLARTLAVALAAVLTVTLASCSWRAPTEGTTSVPLPADQRIVAVVRASATIPEHPALGPLLQSSFSAVGLPLQVHASDSSANQTSALQAAARDGVHTVLVEPATTDSLTDTLKTLKKDGVSVVCLGNRPDDPGVCSVIVGWDRFGGGLLQGDLFEHALGARPDDRRWNIEALGLDADDTNTMAQFNGVIFGLRPYDPLSPTQVKTGQQSYSQVSVPGGSLTGIGKHLATSLEATYPTWPLDGLVLPTDALVPTVQTTLAQAHKPVRVLVGSGATPDGVRWVMDGTLAATLYYDPAVLAKAAASTVQTLRSGKELRINPRRTNDNKARGVPAVWVLPTAVTKVTAAKALASSPGLLALVNG